MGRIVKWMDRNLYPEYANRWDDQIFREEILKIVQKDHTVLDVGAGIGIIPLMDFRKKAERICGIDPDERVLENPYLDEAKVAVGESIPYPDATFDLVFSDNVLEHCRSRRSSSMRWRGFLSPVEGFWQRRQTVVITCLLSPVYPPTGSTSG